MNQDAIKLPLPPEIIVNISNYLNIKDKLNLRLINKSFKFVFDNLIRLHRLTLISHEIAFNWNWFYTNRPNNEIDLIKLNDVNILNDLFKINLFLNVKKLFFQSNEFINLNESINQLKYLEELNIKCSLKSDTRLSLSNLKILSVQQQKLISYKMELETPSLSFLRCDNLNNYQFNYPQTIIYLDTELMINQIEANPIKNNQIEIFKNLEYLILYRKYNELKPILLAKLNDLKELHFNIKSIYQNNLNEIIEFYQQKLQLKLDNLRIFLSGIDFEYLNELERNQLIRKCNTDLIFQNYSKTIDIIPFIYRIDFDELLNFLNSNPISLDNIINKFPNIKKITADNLIKKGYVVNFKLAKKDDINCFFKFLIKCNNLVSLSLPLNLILEEQLHYYKKLPKLCNRIEILDISSFDIWDDSTDFNFLYKFNKLSKLSLGDVISDDVLKNVSDYYGNISIEFGYYLKYTSYRVVFQNDKYYYNDREFDSDDIYSYLYNSFYGCNTDSEY